MEIETLNTMNAGLQNSLMTMIEVIVLVSVLFAITGITIYLAGIAWFCFKQKRRSKTALRTARRALSSNMWKSAPCVPNTEYRRYFAKYYYYRAED